jgi:DNA-binding NarL/FixJ family response regulator
MLLQGSARGGSCSKTMASADPIRVVLIDDDRALMDGLRQLIAAADGFCCVGVFCSVEEALPALSSKRPDVLLLDIDLPGIRGSEAVPLLLEKQPSMQILMLSVLADEWSVFTSICKGASGYLLKTTPPAQLLEAITAARSGGSPISPEIARYIVTLFQKTGPVATPALPPTPQERRLLSLLSDGYGYQDAARQMNVSINTVRNYIRSIYEKLHVHSKSEAVGKALRERWIR